MIKIVNKDILNCRENIIVHQVNVAGVMRRWSCTATGKKI